MNPFQEIYDKQKAYFNSDATKTYEWRIEKLTRLENLLTENSQALEDAVSSDFKTAVSERVFEVQAPLLTAAFSKADLKEWMKPIDVSHPSGCGASEPLPASTAVRSTKSDGRRGGVAAILW